MFKSKLPVGILLLLLSVQVHAASNSTVVNKFRQLDELLPSANTQRLATGAPGPDYWQQKVDYRINVELDDERQLIKGEEVISYHNRSPHELSYLWLQLDQNRFVPNSAANRSRAVSRDNEIAFSSLRSELNSEIFDGGFNIHSVEDTHGLGLDYTVVGTMMRVDLKKTLKAGSTFRFSVKWSFKLINRDDMFGRSGYEYFEEDGNYMYEVSQWYPRLAVYSAHDGWHHKQFLGKGEFALEFGDFDVSITVPEDHIVAATGELQNPQQVLTAEQRQRLKKAHTATEPVLIVTPKEAVANQKLRGKGRKTWRFSATNVRDFAFGSSRKFIWDAQGYKQAGNGKRVMAMSFYPEESNPLWGKYATAAVIHTLDVYSRFTFPYPYPVAQIVNSAASGMEYPMIGFTAVPRSKEKETGKRTYSRADKTELIAVVIHEVGHNYFPMIVNSDERKWAWLDEGLTSFLEFVAENEWENDFAGSAFWVNSVQSYMASDRQYPVMTQPDSLFSSYNNAYVKVTVALNILRETVLGRELFDFAFREYARRWYFRHPTPADFFRTMEDASGVDLDWFWRGWFYSTDHVDISLDKVTRFRVDSRDPDKEQALQREKRLSEDRNLTHQRNASVEKLVERYPQLSDFYNEYDEYTVTDKQRNAYREMLDSMEEKDKKLLLLDSNIYRLDFTNLGGLVMPIILKLGYQDGSSEELRLPAEIWRKDPGKVSKLLIREKDIVAITVDPHRETADVNTENNHYPRHIEDAILKLKGEEKAGNLMKEIQNISE